MASFIRGLISSCLRRPPRFSLTQIRGLSGGRRVSSPWLMLPPSFENGGMSYNFYSLAENKLVSFKKKSEPASESPDDDALFVGSSHGWLALYNHRGDGRLFLSNPVTGENISLPPPDTRRYHHLLSEREREECLVRKVILSSSPHRDDCRAMMTLLTGHLALCSPGRCTGWDDKIGWSFRDFEFADVFVDVVHSPTEELFFSLVEFNKYEDEAEAELDLVEWAAYDCPDELEEFNRHYLDEFSYNKHNLFDRSSREERAELKFEDIIYQS